MVREAFHERRAHLLTGDHHNLDVLGPYARLHLRVREAKHLLALDAVGTSDPYVEVFVNDMPKGRSSHLQRTLNPKWDYGLVLDIWSPFSIVRVAVMDFDRFTKDDFIGFVEFRVAEVEPNGKWVSGWCELRLAGMLEGTATHRFKRHRSSRDDHQHLVGDGASCGDIDHLGGGDVSPSSRTYIPPSQSDSSFVSPEDAAAKRAEEAKRPLRRFRLKRVRNMKAAICCGHGLNGGKESLHSLTPPPPRSCGGKRLNGGEVHLSMRLETVAKPAQQLPEQLQGERPQPTLGYVLLSSLLCPSRLLDICQDEEWYACCFPRPEFETAGEEEEDAFSLQDIKEFYEDASQLKAMVLNCFAWPLVSIFFYIVSWRDFALSSALLAYWLAFCLWPYLLLPTLPLWGAFWLHRLRDRGRCNDLLAHEQTAPLTEDGLRMLASLRSTKRMAVWLRRLVKDRGGWVDKMAALKDFARLTHKDGEPTLKFDDLIADLVGRPWVSRRVAREKRCREGHVLRLLGMGAYLPDDGWVCSGPAEHACCPAGITEVGLHLGTRRYRCLECRLDLCGLCAIGDRALPPVMRMDTTKLPMGGSVMMRAMRDFVMENEDAVDDLKEIVEGILKVAEKLKCPQELDLAFRAYMACGVASVGLGAIEILLLSRFGFLLRWAWVLLWMAIGSVVMVQGAMPIRRMRTAYRASRDFARCRDIRQRGGCTRWQFFTLDPESPCPEQEQPGSSRSAGPQRLWPGFIGHGTPRGA